MARPVAPSLPNAEDLPALQRLRQVLTEAGFTQAGIGSIIGPLELPTRRGENVPRLLHAALGDTPLHTLVRLFIVGVPVEPEAARRAFRPLSLSQVAEMGLVVEANGAVRATVSLLAWNGLLLACDRTQQGEGEAGLNLVMSPWCGSTNELVQFAVSQPSPRALDLGTGCGVLALLAALQCQEVLAIDVNPRAVHFATFNARLNGLSNVACLQGDRLEPVRGQRFDLIRCNPPFVISPFRQIAFRDSGEEADGFCRHLARQVPAFLNEGGYFQMIFQWIERAGEDWDEVLTRWFSETGCDVWVLGLDTTDPSSYAQEAIGETAPDDPEAAGRLYEQWTDYYRQNRVAAIGTGLVTMRRSTRRPNFLRFDQAPEDRSEPYGDAVCQGFRACDFLEQLGSDDELLQEKLRLPEGLELVQQSQWGASGWEGECYEVRLAAGLRFSAQVDEEIALLFSLCNGECTLRKLLEQAAAGSSNGNKGRWSQEALPTVRELIRHGFLLPVRLS